MTECVTATLPWGQVVTVTGDYAHHYETINGCDSLVTIHVTINPSFNLTAAPMTVCVTATLPWGQVVTVTGDYAHHYETINGCDSLVTIHVTINPSFNLTGAPMTECVTATLPWGQVVTATGDYAHHYETINVCDSLVTIHVTINPSFNLTGAPMTECVTATLPCAQLVTVTGDYAHHYETINGCDSLVTIHVTINP